MKIDGRGFIFELLYIAVAITTFSHTSWSASLVFEGQPSLGTPHYGLSEWHIPGILMAISIDIGMIVVAYFLKNAKTWWAITTFVATFSVLTLSSFMFQLLYALEHTSSFTFGAGVTEMWQNVLQPIVDARVVLVPAVLPAIAILYTLAGIGNSKDKRQPKLELVGGEVVIDKKPLPGFISLTPEIEEDVDLLPNNGWHCKKCGYEKDGYKTPRSRNIAIKSHFTREHSYPELSDEPVDERH